MEEKISTENENGQVRDERVQSLYDAFFDSRSVREKRDILRQLRMDLTSKMLIDFAVTLDVALPEGDIDSQYYSLMQCLDTMARFETTGLR